MSRLREVKVQIHGGEVQTHGGCFQLSVAAIVHEIDHRVLMDPSARDRLVGVGHGVDQDIGTGRVTPLIEKHRSLKGKLRIALGSPTWLSTVIMCQSKLKFELQHLHQPKLLPLLLHQQHQGCWRQPFRLQTEMPVSFSQVLTMPRCNIISRKS